MKSNELDLVLEMGLYVTLARSCDPGLKAERSGLRSGSLLGS